MGGLVSRTPRGDEEEGFDFEEPRRQGSIEVPGIVLTEPIPDLPPRTPSPPPKSILLLPPASLPIPSEKTISPHGTFSLSPRFASMISGRSQGNVGTTLRSVLLLGALCLGAWHLYTSLDMSTLVEDAAGH
ncbi:hypothetical protein DB88DRAFT_512825 [Papiliotrema laurentii]|uniref:Uncharacterized protein n=1 Tax=Papiliotrema laurentii TaxID=5418 RepID=A0AAD9FJG2_PAPLA|nr:hypothetical protein DB88DRAFT_512825 [Papiliotrema laurentii]